MKKKSTRRFRFQYVNRETSAWTIVTSGAPDASDLYPEIDPEELPEEVPTLYEIPAAMFHSLYNHYVRQEAGAVKGAKQIIERLSKKLNISKQQASQFYTALCEEMAETLMNMGRFSLMGLGTFMPHITHQKRFMSGPLADVLCIRYCRRVTPMFFPSPEFEKLFIQKYGSRLVRGWELRNRRTGRYSKKAKAILAVREIPEEELLPEQQRQHYLHQYLQPEKQLTEKKEEKKQ